MSGKAGSPPNDTAAEPRPSAEASETDLLLRLDETNRRIAERSLELAEATSRTIAEMTLRAQQQQTEALERTAQAVAQLLPPLPSGKARSSRDTSKKP